MVDPIEANALHGGRMSLTDSIIVAVQNLISNGFGASVGLEAGYTQLAAGIASKFGHKLQMRRADLRMLVGCGAAGAIAAAFNAPLTGAFYAFELIIGTYTIVTLTPVVVSALISTLIARLLAGDDFTIDIGHFGAIVPADYLPALLLGAFCAGIGILIMQGVALVEELARKSSIPPPLRPALGGIVVGLLALISPQVLSAGHGALHLNLGRDVAAADPDRPFSAEIPRLGRIDRFRLQRRPVLRVAVHGRAARQDFCLLRPLFRSCDADAGRSMPWSA